MSNILNLSTSICEDNNIQNLLIVNERMQFKCLLIVYWANVKQFPFLVPLTVSIYQDLPSRNSWGHMHRFRLIITVIENNVDLVIQYLQSTSSYHVVSFLLTKSKCSGEQDFGQQGYWVDHVLSKISTILHDLACHSNSLLSWKHQCLHGNNH